MLRIRHIGLQPLLWCALVVTACDGEQRAAVWPPADVVVVDNAALAPDSLLGWTVGGAPVLEIGFQVDAEAYHLFAVRDAAVLALSLIHI